MKFYLMLLLIIIYVPTVLADKNYPNLETINVGKPFPHPKADDFPDEDRPTTQYKKCKKGSDPFSGNRQGRPSAKIEFNDLPAPLFPEK